MIRQGLLVQIATLTLLHGLHRFKIVERLDKVVNQCLEISQDADEQPGLFKSQDDCRRLASID